MHSLRPWFAVVACGVVVGSLPFPARAVPHAIAAPPAIRRAAVGRQQPQPQRGHRLGSRRFFGTIVAIAGSQVTVRTRSGRSRIVDASAVLANGDYSYPLFIGKLVSIDGTFAGNAFVAAHIAALPSLATLGDDR